MADTIAAIASRKRQRRYLVVAVIGIVLIVGVIGALQPWTANHFGYALPGAGHLPYRVSYAGRAYSNQWMCAGGDWCQQQTGPGYCGGAASCSRPATLCTTSNELRQLGELPLRRVGAVWTLFGTPHGLYVGQHGALTAGVFLEDTPGCFVAYSLEGGP